MKEKFKKIYISGKNWCKKNKKKIIGIAIFVGGIFVGAKIKAKKNNSNYEIENYDFDEGRDCRMTFMVDDDTNEVLGEVPCTEAYAKDMIECFGDSKISE